MLCCWGMQPDAATLRLTAAMLDQAVVDEIISCCMAKRQQMRWSQAAVQPFLDVHTAVLNDTVEQAFHRRQLGFRPASDNHKLTGAAV